MHNEKVSTAGSVRSQNSRLRKSDLSFFNFSTDSPMHNNPLLLILLFFRLRLRYLRSLQALIIPKKLNTPRSPTVLY